MALVAKASRRTASQLPESGWAALGDGQWEEARSSLQEALADEETPEAVEGLSWAAWWLDDADTVFEARERAFRLYLVIAIVIVAVLALRAFLAHTEGLISRRPRSGAPRA
jgi:hypothetical protein